MHPTPSCQDYQDDKEELSLNQNKLQTARVYRDWMARAFLFYRIALVLLILGAVIIPQAFAVEDGRFVGHGGRLR